MENPGSTSVAKSEILLVFSSTMPRFKPTLRSSLGSHVEDMPEQSDEDTIEVKNETIIDHDLSEGLSSTRVSTIKDEPLSRSGTPTSMNMKVKASVSSSASTPRAKSEPGEPAVKADEDITNGHDSPRIDLAASRKNSRVSKKVVPRVAPLFDDLPDATDEANESYSVIDACIYQNKYLGYTEHAMECDCSEEWGKSSTCFWRATIRKAMLTGQRQMLRLDRIMPAATTRTASTVRQKWSVSGTALAVPHAKTNAFGVACTLKSQ